MSLEITIFCLIMMVKKCSRLFILKFKEPLQSCCYPVQKYLPRMVELAWQLTWYLWRGLVNFKINSRPLFTIIFKLKNDSSETRDFRPLSERVLAGVSSHNNKYCSFVLLMSFERKFHALISQYRFWNTDRGSYW